MSPRSEQNQPLQTSVQRRRIRRLVAWFDRHARDLPWRRDRNGYAALVAEAMLLQTQVSRVVDRYERFMQRFPTVQQLAAANEQDVLAAWQGLGYYRRAINLHEAAKVVVEQFAGRVPERAADLRRLPGVGRYTAGAIASIVFGHREPIVDGNVMRVLARWWVDGTSPESAEAQRTAWSRAAELAALAPEPGRFNEALMELGALVCTPRSPSCHACPVAGDCLAFREGRQEVIPPPKARARQISVHHHAVLVVRGERLLVEQRNAGLWARMWQPPTVEAAVRLSRDRVGRALAERGIAVRDLTRCGGFVHQTTHRQVSFHVFAGVAAGRRGRWHPMDALDELPMSNAHRRMVSEWGVAAS